MSLLSGFSENGPALRLVHADSLQVKLLSDADYSGFREGALVIRFLDCYMVDASVHELPNYLVSESHTILWCFTFLHCREPTLDPVASLVIVCINAVSLPPALAIPTPVLQTTNCALMRKHFSLEPSSLVNTDVVFTEFEYQIPFMK